MLLAGCAVEPKVIVTKVSDCSIVPYIKLTNKQIDALLLDELFHSVIVDIDKQSRIIDLCK